MATIAKNMKTDKMKDKEYVKRMIHTLDLKIQSYERLNDEYIARFGKPNEKTTKIINDLINEREKYYVALHNLSFPPVY